MGRPEPCVLFAQSFIHPHLNEYVDEVMFTEPVVIASCEFIEQNASSSSPMVTLNGATSPPSFALEVFVHCEGESRFRRLCQPFLYSHSSSNVLEVEAVVTNHLVVRGTYRSLTLVVFGNTAEDLGQFNIEFDLDSSLANLVSSPSTGKLEDLPIALHITKSSFEESITPLKSLSPLKAEIDLSLEMNQFLHLTLKIWQISNLEDIFQRYYSVVVSVVSSYVASDLSGPTITWNQYMQDGTINCNKELQCVVSDARNELLGLYKRLQQASGNELGDTTSLELEAELTTPELLADVFNHCFLFKRKLPTNEVTLLSKNENLIIELSMVLLLVSGSESCFHFVNGGGMEHVVHLFSREAQRPMATTLILLGIVERATRHAIGCEGFLGWWPREDENVPIGSSEGYSHLLKLLMLKQSHDVASLTTYILHRLRLYEVASRYESAILDVLGSLSTGGKVTNNSLKSLVTANSQLKKLLKLLNLRGPIEDPSPVARAARLMHVPSDGLLTYGATVNLVTSSKYCSAELDVDSRLLLLLKERGFLPLSAALLSSPLLRSETGHTMDIFVDIAASIEAILLSLLFCRSGLVFLLHHHEITAALILALQGIEGTDMAVCVPLRYAAVLISKGFLCRTQHVGMIIELHLRVVNAIDRVLTAAPHSEELLWILWELCALSRSDSGRQALLTLRHFPEAIVLMLESLRSVKELQPMASNNGTLPSSLAIFHSAAELFEIMVTDSTASSLASWIAHAVELHKALHSSAPGSNRKDAPTRLLEWIDAGVVYHKNGALGLLRYAAVLASGGDAHLTSTSILVSDSMDVENVVGSDTGSDVQVIENLLGKLVSDKFFDGIILRASSIAQLTTAFRILAFISENAAVAISLYEEGAATLIYVVLVNCKLMLERSSKTYDYLVDEGAECNSTSDLLLERSHEQSLIDLMIPSLVLLITLMRKLQEAKEQHRNTKLLNALLRLHREVSPKLAACAADVSSPYPGSALGLGTVSRLIVSALAFWPVFGWTPGLFHCLLESVQATSLLALGPKEACSLLCLLGDLFPEEGIWLWKKGMPSLSALRTLGVATLLGPEKEKDVDWYLQPGHLSVMLSRLTPLLHQIAEIVLHFSFTAMVVIQDMLRVFIVRIACQKTDTAVTLLRPTMSWIQDHVSKSAHLSDTDVFKVHQVLDFVSSLLEHPKAKALLLKEGAAELLIRSLERIIDTFSQDGKLLSETKMPIRNGVSLLSWCLPVFKSLALLSDRQAPLHLTGVYDKSSFESLGGEECSVIMRHLLKLCQVLPVGNELLACLEAFKEFASSSHARGAFVLSFIHIQSSAQEELESRIGMAREGNGSIPDEYDWRRCPPLLQCWKNLLRSIDAKDCYSIFAMEALNTLCLGASCLCTEGKNMEGTFVLRFLFGLPPDLNDGDDCPEEYLKDVQQLLPILDLRMTEDDSEPFSNTKITIHQVKESVKSMLLLLQKTPGSAKVENLQESVEPLIPSEIYPLHSIMPSLTTLNSNDDEAGASFSRVGRSDGNAEKGSSYFSLGGLADRFLWECPDSSPDRMSMLSQPGKKKLTPVEGSGKRVRGDNSGSENMGTNAFSRGMGSSSSASGHTRRDTFRQRKPNTSRPPSMHVDDYVARERNVDSMTSGSNIATSAQRGGSTGGRPPSIHVDEFMARQRERQNPVATGVGEVVQVRNAPLENENDADKPDRSRQLKADLDDDLQEIDIVFDDESESDDRLPFPQPDDNLLAAPVITGESSPRSIVEETENDVNESTQLTHLSAPLESKVDGNSHGESLRRSVSRSEMPLTREVSVSSDNFPLTNSEKAFFHEQVDQTKHAIPLIASKGVDSSTTPNLPTFSSQFYGKGSTPSSIQSFRDSRLPPPPFYQWDSTQPTVSASIATASPGHFDQKPPYTQPPLPPLPPPPAVSSVPAQFPEPIQSHSSPFSHSVRDVQPSIHQVYPLQAFDANTVPALNAREDRPLGHNTPVGLVQPPASSSAFPESLNHPFHSQLHTEYSSTASNSSSTSLTTLHPVAESKYSWSSVSSGGRMHDETSASSGSGRLPQPPLPPTPPPYSASSVTQSSVKNLSQSSPYNQTGVGGQVPLPTSYSLPPFVPLPSKPASVPGTPFSSTPMQQQLQNPPSLLHAIPSPQPSVQSVQPRLPLIPLQPPLPPHPPQHPRPLPIQISQQQLEQGASLQQSPIQVQVQPLQIQQQLHLPQMQVYYQPQRQEPLSQPQHQQVEHAQPHAALQHGDNAPTPQPPPAQQESGITLQHYFSSPEAIQSLLSDREKLCQLLEQHPKLMQMLQDRLK
ncbi:hypothetical protein AAC387_Pa07g0258 [Persea americana]